MGGPAADFILLLFAFILASTLPTCKGTGCSPPPMQEGSQGTLVCTFPTSINLLLWQVQREGKFINVSSCNIQGQCQNQTSSYWSSGQISTNRTEFKSVLTISSVNRSESVIKCVVDGGIDAIICNLQVYVGPSSVTTKVSSSIFNICPTNNDTLTVTCNVLSDHVFPEPKFNIIIDSQPHAQNQTGNQTSEGFSYPYSFRPLSGGNIPVKCQAENSIFPGAKTENMVQIEVREPPSRAPQIFLSLHGYDIHTTDIISVNNGDIITVTCRVGGGYPLVQSVTLQCGYQRRVSIGSPSTLLLTASNQINGQLCHCHANHISSCYNQIAGIILGLTISDSRDKETNNVPLIVGISVGLCAIIVAIVVVVLVMRKRKRRLPSRPPSYCSNRINNPNNGAVTSLSGSISGDSHLEYSLPIDFTKTSDSNIYDIIAPPSYHSRSVNGYCDFEPTPHRTNARYDDGYIEPIA